MRCGWSSSYMGSERAEWPRTYRICLEGVVASPWSDRLGDMDGTVEWREGRGPVTVLLGSLTDQAALSGVLETLFDLRLPLLSVESVETRDASPRGLFIS